MFASSLAELGQSGSPNKLAKSVCNEVAEYPRNNVVKCNASGYLPTLHGAMVFTIPWMVSAQYREYGGCVSVSIYNKRVSQILGQVAVDG